MIHRGRWLGLVCAGGLALACALEFRVSDAAAATPARSNPHWRKDGCAECHAMEAGKARPIAIMAVDSLCLGCHDGRTASAESHAIGRPLKATSRPGSQWPTADGRLSCITCHDARQACDQAAQRPAANPRFLRLAGTGNAQAFCGACHEPQHLGRRDPHRMVTADRREIIPEQCLVCHDAVPDRASVARTHKPALRAPEPLSCRACHPVHRDAAPRGHMGALVDPDMLAYMRAREMVGLTGAPSALLLKDLKNRKVMPTQMPLDANGRMTCVTCHNPHQAGVFPTTSPLSAGAMRIVDGKTLSPVRGRQWCNHCHQL